MRPEHKSLSFLLREYAASEPNRRLLWSENRWYTAGEMQAHAAAAACWLRTQGISAPASSPHTSARMGCPAMATTAQTHIPATKLPSMVRSGVFNIRNATKTPSAMGA